MSNQLIIRDGDGEKLELAINAWLHAKHGRSGSENTLENYRADLQSFRYYLNDSGLDLTSDTRFVALKLQAWASRPVERDEVSAATFNRRLAVVSSFYRYVQKMGLLDLRNPAERVERRKTTKYRGASPLANSFVKRKLAEIDLKTPVGKRDYALLLIGLTTGRRISELANIRLDDVTSEDDNRYTVHFRRTKGGKTMTDTLGILVSRALSDWIAWLRDNIEFRYDDPPLFISFSNHNYAQGIGRQTVARICEQRLGVTKGHTLRHTFAVTMLANNAKVTDIKAKLGHESLATTDAYLHALTDKTNPHADEIANSFLEEPTDDPHNPQ